MNRAPAQEIFAAITAVATDVFGTMLGAEIQVGEPREENVSPQTEGVVVVLGIGGLWSGLGRLYCSTEAACRIATALLGEEHEQVDEMVLDACAEMANMIIGNVKTIFEQKVGPLSLGIPTVVYGDSYHTHSSVGGHWTVVPMHFEGGSLEVCFLLAKTEKQPWRGRRVSPSAIAPTLTGGA